MTKSPRIHYNYSGSEEDYRTLLRKFRLDSLLHKINDLSASIMHNDDHGELYGAKEMTFTLTNPRSGRPEKQKTLVTGWNLVDLAYDAKPFVATSAGRTISVNCFLNLFLCEHCIHWIIRDHYQKRGIQDFPSVFGQLFEQYFENVLKV